MIDSCSKFPSMISNFTRRHDLLKMLNYFKFKVGAEIGVAEGLRLRLALTLGDKFVLVFYKEGI